MTGRMMNETLGKLHFWITFIGTYCIFMPFHYLGLVGNIRRYSTFVDDFMGPLMPVHKFITIAALITGAGQLIFFYNLFTAASGASPRRKIRGTAPRSSGAFRRLRHGIILATCIRWSITIRISTA